MFTPLLLAGCLWISSEDVNRRLEDGDGDGFASAARGGGDCDDGDAETYPGAAEICGDGVDQDCDREPTDCRFLAEEPLETIVLIGERPGDFAGSLVALPGDVDGDGAPDMLIGAYGAGDLDGDEGGEGGEGRGDEGGEEGAVYLVRGPPGEPRAAADADARFHGTSAGDRAGFSIAGPGDVDGDGLGDILIGAPFADEGASPNSGAAYLYYDPPDGDLAVADADAVLVGPGMDDNVGDHVARAGDLNADGFADVLVGAGALDRGEITDAGAAFVLYGPIHGTLTLDSANASVVGTGKDQYLGSSLCGPGDIDGDGMDDVWVSAPRWDGPTGAAMDAGAAFLVLGPVDGEVSAAQSDASIFATSSQDYYGSDVAGADVDDDGYADVLALSPGDDRGGAEAGAVFLYRGPLSGTTAVDGYSAVWLGSSGGPLYPQIHIAGDLDGDGAIDLVISAGNDDGAGDDAGAVRVVYGPLRSDSDVRDLVGKEGDHAGWAVVGGSDLDADGLDDLLIGGYGHGADAGVAWFVAGSGP